MKIVVQDFKSGKLSVSNMPEPALSADKVLIRTHASLISAGTDRSIISLGKKSYLGKALDRPDLAMKVIKRARTEGLWGTYKVVQNLIAEPIPLGYSLVGTVVAVGRNITDIAVGDRVAGAGLGHANHAEVVAIPRHLAVRVPDAVSDEQAAYVTLGAIAMHGLRQADQQFGATVLVVGLGLVGQITVQLAKAAGLRVIGTDLEQSKMDLAIENGAVAAFKPGDPSLAQAVKSMTGGFGVDAVLLTVGSRDSGAIFEDVAALCRDRARVVVVGDVKMDLSRRTYFEKELDIRQSRSYGPGRYDPAYEDRGHDYPIGYVRWTEGRNLEIFLTMIAEGRLDPTNLTTHRFPIEKGEEAYDLVTGKKGGASIGIVLEYDHDKPLEDHPAPAIKRPATTSGKIGLGAIGTGQFAKGILLPAIMDSGAFDLRGVASMKGVSAKIVSQRYGAAYGGSDADRVLDDPDVQAVIVTTRHDSHANYVVEALERGKHVFVEKPLAIIPEDLSRIEEAARSSTATLTVGFNRRFSPMVRAMKAHFASAREPLNMLYRVNAGRIPLDSENAWVHDHATGGGRIIGEACHFIDTLQYICDARPVNVSVTGSNPHRRDLAGDDSVTFSISFEDGSVGTVHYWSNGDANLPKEYVEVFGAERTAIMSNFRRLDLMQGGRRKTTRSLNVDKGFAAEAKAFADACRTATPPISLDSLIDTTAVTFAVAADQFGETGLEGDALETNNRE